MSRFAGVVICALSVLVLPMGCSSKDDAKKTDNSANKGKTPGTKKTPTGVKDKKGPGPSKPAADAKLLVDTVGVKAGAWEYGKDIGPDGIVSELKGTVEIRRVGVESFAKAEQDAMLFPGDVVRSGPDSSATLLLVDETAVELTHDTVVAIGDRNASADPGSSAAVLYGVARFTVSKRGQGEASFLVYTPSAVVGTTGTTYAVGVAADGQMRVGVEDGKIEVAAISKPNATIAVDAGNSVSAQIEGSVGSPTKFGEDDWGEWRDTTDAAGDPTVLVKGHAKALGQLQTDITKGFAEMDELNKTNMKNGAEATTFEKTNNVDGYIKVAPDYGANIEASYLLSLRLQHLTYAQLSHAYLAQELHLRHPTKTQTGYAPIRRRVAASILFHKRYHAVVHRQVRPWRPLYYRHHPVGRRRTVVLAGAGPLPKFYKKRALRDIEPKRVRGRLRVRAVYRPPLIVSAGDKRVWLKPRKRGWHAKVKLRKHKYRGKHWYVRAKAPKARVFVGVKVRGPRVRVFRKVKRTKRGATVRWGIGGRPGMRRGLRVRRGDPRLKNPGRRMRIRRGKKGQRLFQRPLLRRGKGNIRRRGPVLRRRGPGHRPAPRRRPGQRKGLKRGKRHKR